MTGFQYTGGGSNAGVRLTPEGGIAVRLKNSTASSIPHGTALAASPDHDMSVVPQSTEFDVAGIAYGAIAAGAWGWVVVTGIAECLFEDGNAPIHGYWCRAAVTDGRVIADASPTGISAVASSVHFREVGHCLESKSAGTNVLAKLMIHPL